MTNRKSIAIIEDDPGYQDLLQALLGKTYELSIRSNAEAGLELLKQRRFDLLVLDINLLGMTGLELLEQLRADERHKSLRVVVCSSDSDPKTREQALAIGADAFLTKPYPNEHLELVVSELLANPR